MKTIITRILRLREQLILVFMLELLHFAIWTDFSGPVSRSLLLMHLGFFLIWQPLWKGEEKLRWYDIVLLLVITYAFVFWIDWRLLFAWIILLIGLVGGRVMVNRRERTIYMLTLVFLVFQILIRCTPMLFDIVITTNTRDLFQILLPILPLFILLLPVSKDENRFQSVDFVHAISLSTLTSLLVAGTLLNMYRNETDYTPVTGALYFHCKLLVQLINNFYVAKLRERELTQQTHLQAVYQTGARITHDIKNLLQSLQAITSVIVNDNDQDDYLVSRRLMQKQLPVLTQRLKLALEKLQTPETGEQEPIYLKDWWQDLNVVLAICDTGNSIPEDKAKVILREPLQSHNGLGIGLYQAARQAEGLGYQITLTSNLDGKVCFELAKQDPSAQISLI
jgi:signal transduction histidine kinase